MTETALITGASSGIGLELARLFAADGSDLVLVARRGHRLETLASELRAANDVRVDVLVTDLADAKAPAEIHGWLDHHRRAVDVLVNNAGFGARGRFAELDAGRQRDMLEVNVAALTALTRLLLPAMLERRRGAILNVGSTAGFQPGPSMAVYTAGKAYVLHFTEALAEELRATGVSVTLLAPGATMTEFASAAGMTDSRVFRLKGAAMDAGEVAKAGFDGMRQGRVIVIPGLRNRVAASIARLLPRTVTRRLTGAIMGR